MSSATIYRGPRQPDVDIDARVAALEKLLRAAAGEFAVIRLASSLAAEDNLLFDAIARLQLPIDCFSLDTGLLPPETLAIAATLQAHYQRPVAWFHPQPAAVAAYLAENGDNAFYRSLELRRTCCQLRKVEPLARALAGADAWITGQRAGQSATRGGLAEREADPAHGLIKLNPLAEWSEAEVWTYLRRYAVPVNPLHHAGYPSLGCAPCTRAITVGEDIRAGRWWWENPEHKECGLHPQGHSSPLPSSPLAEKSA